MFKRNDIERFEKKVWLATPTMHGEELQYIQQAYDTNWMSTVGENINEVERIAAEKAGVKYAVGLSCCTAALHLAVKHAGERLYGKPAISHGIMSTQLCKHSERIYKSQPAPQSKSSLPRITLQFG